MRGSTSGKGPRANIGGGASPGSNQKARGFLHSLKSGRARRGGGPGYTQSRGGSSRQNRPGGAAQNSAALRSSSPSQGQPTTQNEYMNQMVEKYNSLKIKREQERAKAIRDGILADPEKKTTLDQAITPVGTCTEMCPEYERIQRIVQNAVDRTEKVHNETIGRDMPAEEKMVKRFRRSAAGDDEQLPSDIRTPATLKRSLDYLINDVIGTGENLATVHKFVWDRTRSIRNDFSIQQVSKPEDVQLAVQCFERIARFHILSLHQLSNPENLQGGNFDAHQEREQLNNTLLSLMYYYDDYRHRQTFKYEAEFRAYCIVLEMQATHPDLEDRMQAWPKDLLKDPSVQNAFELHAAASNTFIDQGPLKPTTPFLIARSNHEGFWKLLKSLKIPYLMACLAESHFGQIRYVALRNIWKANKKAPIGQQKQNKQWNLDELTAALAFDDYDQTKEFCENFGVGFQPDDEDLEYLDFTSSSSDTLEPVLGMNRQVFSHDVVEKKRLWRTFAAAINGMTVAEAIRHGMVEETYGSEGGQEDMQDDLELENSLFFPENHNTCAAPTPSQPTIPFNATATTFKPETGAETASSPTPSIFGQNQKQQIGFPSVFGAPTVPQGASSSTSGRTPAVSSFGGSQQNAASFVNPFKSAAEQGKSPGISWGTPSNSATNPATISTGNAEGSSPASNLTWPSKNAPSSFGQPSSTAILPGTQGSIINFEQPPVTEALQQQRPLSDPFPHAFNAVSPSSKGEINLKNASDGIQPPPSPRPHKRELAPPERPSSAGFNFQSSQSDLASPLFSSPSPSSSSDFTSRPDYSQSHPHVSSTPNFAPQAAAPSLGTRPFSKPGLSAAQSTQHPLSEGTAPRSESRDTQKGTVDPASPVSVQAPAFSFTPSKPSIPQTFTPTAPPPRFKPDPRPRTSSPLAQPPETIPQSPEKPIIPKKHSSQALSNVNHGAVSERLARLALTEDRGLLQQFVEYKAIKIIEDTTLQFETAQRDKQVAEFRFYRLARKFGQHWRDITYRKKLNRRAKQRRSIFALTMRQESLRKQRSEEELQSILQAAKEKAEIQATQQRESLERSVEARSPILNGNILPKMPPLTAGKKRKSLPNQDRDSSTSTGPQPSINGHKRSRTVSQLDEEMPGHRFSVSPTHTSKRPFASSVFSGRSILLDYPDSTEIQAAARQRKVDRTHTDYFRLKARGLDPETTSTPHTNESLDRKRKIEDDEKSSRDSNLTWLGRRKRGSTMTEKMNPLLARALRSQSTTLPTSSPRACSPSTPRIASMSPSLKVSLPPRKSTVVGGDDDDLLRQLREVRNALSDDTSWFREQAERFEEEERRSSELESDPGRQQSLRLSTFSDSVGSSLVNGYNFTSSARGVLSRSEQRLRSTGGYGLATKPVEDYLPGGPRYIPAMSKKGAAAFQARTSSQGSNKEPELGVTNKQKGKRKVVDPTYRYESDEDDEFISPKRAKVMNHRHTVKPNHQIDPSNDTAGLEEGALDMARHLQGNFDQDEFDDNNHSQYTTELDQAQHCDGESQVELDEEQQSSNEGCYEQAVHQSGYYTQGQRESHAEDNDEEGGYYAEEGDEGDDEDGEDDDEGGEGEFYGDDEDEYEGYEDEMGDHRSYSESASANASQDFIAGPGATQEDALVLSD